MTTPIPESTLTEWEKLCEEATPEFRPVRSVTCGHLRNESNYHRDATREWTVADIKFIAASRAALPAAIAEIRRLRAELDARDLSLHYMEHEGWDCQSKLKSSVVKACDVMGIPHHEHHRIVVKLDAARKVVEAARDLDGAKSWDAATRLEDELTAALVHHDTITKGPTP